MSNLQSDTAMRRYDGRREGVRGKEKGSEAHRNGRARREERRVPRSTSKLPPKLAHPATMSGTAEEGEGWMRTTLELDEEKFPERE